MRAWLINTKIILNFSDYLFNLDVRNLKGIYVMSLRTLKLNSKAFQTFKFNGSCI